MLKLKYLGSLLSINNWAILLTVQVTLLQFVEKYLFSDLGYMKWLGIAMLVDLITGVTKVWKEEGMKAVTSKGFRDSVSKAVQYGAFIIITHVLTNYEINGQRQNAELAWINTLAYKFLLCIEVKSVYENIIRINPKLDFVGFVLDKIGSYLKNKKS